MTYRIYTDGSWVPNNGSPRAAGAFVVFKGNEEIARQSRVITDKEILTGRQIGGELLGVMMAIEFANTYLGRGCTILVDYQGAFKWFTGEWKAKKSYVKDYLAWMNKKNRDGAGRPIHKLVWVKGHSGENGNEAVDDLAKTTALTGLEVNETADSITAGRLVKSAQGRKEPAKEDDVKEQKESYAHKIVCNMGDELAKKRNPYIMRNGEVATIYGEHTPLEDLGIRFAQMNDPSVLPDDFVAIARHLAVVAEDMPKVKEIFGENAAKCGSYSTKLVNSIIAKQDFDTVPVVTRQGIEDGTAWHNRALAEDLGLDPYVCYNFVAVPMKDGKPAGGIMKGMSAPTNKVNAFAAHETCLKDFNAKHDSVKVFFYKKNAAIDMNIGRQVVHFFKEATPWIENADAELDKIEKMSMLDFLKVSDEAKEVYTVAAALTRIAPQMVHYPYVNRSAKQVLLRRAGKYASGFFTGIGMPLLGHSAIKPGQIGLFPDDDGYLPEKVLFGRNPVLSPTGISEMEVVNMRDLDDIMYDGRRIDAIFVHHKSVAESHNADEDGDYGVISDDPRLLALPRLDAPFDGSKHLVREYKMKDQEYGYDKLAEKLTAARETKLLMRALVVTYEYYVQQQDWANARLFATLAHNNIDGVKKTVVVGDGEDEMPELVHNIYGNHEHYRFAPICSMRKAFKSPNNFFSQKRRERIAAMFTSDHPTDVLACHVFTRVEKILEKLPAEHDAKDFADMFGKGQAWTPQENKEFSHINRRFKEAGWVKDHEVRNNLYRAVHADIDAFARKIGEEKVYRYWYTYNKNTKNGTGAIAARMLAAVNAKAIQYKRTTTVSFNVKKTADMAPGYIGQIEGKELLYQDIAYPIYSDQLYKVSGLHNIEVIDVQKLYPKKMTGKKEANSLRVIAKPVSGRDADDTIRVEEVGNKSITISFNGMVFQYNIEADSAANMEAGAVLSFLKDREFKYDIHWKVCYKAALDTVKADISAVRKGSYHIFPHTEDAQ